MGSILSSAPLPAPRDVSQATQTEWNCLLCHTVQSNTEAVPCGHQFCLGCLLRYTAIDPTCPHCASPVVSARFSVLGPRDFLQCILLPPGEPAGPRSWVQRAVFRLVHTEPQPPAEQGALSSPERPYAGRECFPADLWGELLRGQEHLLDPVRPWLRQSLNAIYGAQWWEARQVESIALSTLCMCGPSREILFFMLQRYLGEYTAPLVHGLINVTLRRCRDAWILRRSQGANGSLVVATDRSGQQDGSAGPSQTHSLSLEPAWPRVEDQPSMPEPTHSWRPAHLRSVPGPAQQSQPRRVPEAYAAIPGPSRPRRGRRRRLRAIRQRYHRRRTLRCRHSLGARRRRRRI